jgi:threonine dehydrogenase-like Zn-dependent dehydrogenase
MKLRGMDVTVFARQPKPSIRSEMLAQIDVRYVSTLEMPLLETGKQYGPFDLTFEATGASQVVFDAMQTVGKNGVLVLSSVTGGNKKVEIPADKINLDFVLGNKLMVGTVNANREYFESGVRDMALGQAMYPGWLEKFLTHPVEGLDKYQDAFTKLETAKEAIKVFYEVAAL